MNTIDTTNAINTTNRIIQNSARIVITPINKNPKSNSYIDYKEQLERVANNKQLMWDDTKFNRQIEGGLFIFCKNNISVHIHIVNKKCDHSERIPSWSKNVGQGDRNVLLISSELIKYDWVEWISMGGPRKVQGTQHVITNKKNIIDHFNNDVARMNTGDD